MIVFLIVKILARNALATGERDIFRWRWWLVKSETFVLHCEVRNVED